MLLLDYGVYSGVSKEYIVIWVTTILFIMRRADLRQVFGIVQVSFTIKKKRFINDLLNDQLTTVGCFLKTEPVLLLTNNSFIKRSFNDYFTKPQFFPILKKKACRRGYSTATSFKTRYMTFHTLSFTLTASQ